MSAILAISDCNTLANEAYCGSNSFKRVGQEENTLWRRIRESDAFKYTFLVAISFATGIAFIAIVLPMEGILLMITAIGFVGLGLFSPILFDEKGFEHWWTACYKLMGLLTDCLALPEAALATPFAFCPNETGG